MDAVRALHCGGEGDGFDRRSQKHLYLLAVDRSIVAVAVAAVVAVACPAASAVGFYYDTHFLAVAVVVVAA
jgi:hypothetical protein